MLNFDQNKLEVEFWRKLASTAPNKEYQVQYKAFELGLSFKGLTLKQQRDFDYFLTTARQEKCYPNHFCVESKLLYKPKTVEEWYWLWDTHGFSGDKELTRPNISDCEGIKQSKEFVNLTIKTWVDSCLELPAVFNFDECKIAYPMPWVWKSFVNQLHKSCIEQDGFITTFIKQQTL